MQALIQSLIGAVIGGVFVLVATWLALHGQFKLQQQEWQRRDSERNEDQALHEKKSLKEAERAEADMLRAAALEALTNSIALSVFVDTIGFGPNVIPDLSRSRYEAALPVILKRLSASRVENVVNVYLSGFRFDAVKKARSKNPVGITLVVEQKDLDEARNLSELFLIAFRTLAWDVFSGDERALFERQKIAAERPKNPNP